MNFRIKEMRKELGLTQEEFANILGVTPGAVKSWEGGSRVPPPIRIEQISKEFGYRIEWIRDGIEPKKVLETSESQAILEKLERDRGKPYPEMVFSLGKIYAELGEVDRKALNALAIKLLESINDQAKKDRE